MEIRRLLPAGEQKRIRMESLLVLDGPAIKNGMRQVEGQGKESETRKGHPPVPATQEENLSLLRVQGREE